MAPLWRNGTLSASNSRSAQPTPTPRMNLPPLSWSMLAPALAISSGLRYGRMATVVPISMDLVVAASQPIVVSGS